MTINGIATAFGNFIVCMADITYGIEVFLFKNSIIITAITNF